MLGKRRAGSSWILPKVVSWCGSSFGVALQYLNISGTCLENLFSRESTHGGISDHGGGHCDLHKILGGWLA